MFCFSFVLLCVWERKQKRGFPRGLTKSGHWTTASTRQERNLEFLAKMNRGKQKTGKSQAQN